MTTSTTSTIPHDVDAFYPLAAEQVSAYSKQGFVRLPHVLSAETVGRYEPEITGKVVELNTQHLPMAERSTYQKAFLQIENLWPHSPLVRELVFSRRLAAIAADLMGVRGVRLYHDQALYKEAGGGITPWHADHYYWPLDSDRTITAWVPLQAVPAAMGPLAFAAGSQIFSFGRDLPLSDESEASLQVALAEQGFPVDSAPYDLGTVSFHNGWTFHRAEENCTAMPRRVMTMIYVDADIRVTEPANEQQRIDRDRWLGGAAAGQVPDGGMNPVLFTR
jgi:ectoine hydroxylase-related dioxygenase (phytanoyl-CoA dioxygenase family)